MKYFYVSFIIAAVGLALSFFIGGFSAVYLTAILAVLEISLSFDNAVVNAKILKDMDKIWERRFLTWGMVIAVFGMRFIFPILIVAVAANMGITETLNIAINHPHQYHEVLLKSENLIYAFGGAFLWLVFTDFLFEHKSVRWIKPVERYAEKLGKVNNISLIVATVIGIIVIYDSKSYEIGIAYLLGMLTYSLLNGINEAFAVEGAKNGLMGFLYLEILDASFSFDGVIGAFAITGNIFLIMIGLGIGAMFVRSLTIWMVEKGVLNEYKYLEHGAHYAIGVLAVIMLLKIFMHIGEVLTGTIGLGLLVIAFLHSKYENR
ncbi:hypothetical protein C3L23_01380 [Nautilia sp. PV-1]|uniref:DUF475 domain-containing protein n=1 Tax=Nautilia sp. PV-1 TaxID=2579250 RepID=UPI000FD9E944|nr:DUF475 domain-containing protein [Nautilia sp. PV-1]AZV45967.1 hypothetical protein C3L23_01380 [Nautilia sp. PV-1]